MFSLGEHMAAPRRKFMFSPICPIFKAIKSLNFDEDSSLVIKLPSSSELYFNYNQKPVKIELLFITSSTNLGCSVIIDRQVSGASAGGFGN